jgi:hypothetical protein
VLLVVLVVLLMHLLLFLLHESWSGCWKRVREVMAKTQTVFVEAAD